LKNNQPLTGYLLAPPNSHKRSVVFGQMTHLASSTLFGSFTNAGQENVSTDRRELAESKLLNTTNTRPLAVIICEPPKTTTL